MKLFPKMALAVSTLLVVTTACLSLFFYWSERRSIRADADQERYALVQNLVHIAQESFLTGDDLLLVKYTPWLRKWNPSLVSASVVGPQGHVLAHSEPSRIGKPLSLGGSASANGHVRVLTQPVHVGPRWVATASASFSERQYEEIVQRRLDGLQRRLAFISAGAIVAGLTISFILALSWTRPIEILTEAARIIGQGRYGLDLTRTNRRRDELGYLSNGFQGMANQLQQLEQLKEDFVSAVTHELRSPLGAIESYLNVIHEEIQEGISLSTWQSYVERMQVNAQRLTRFVNDLLDVAALERGKVILERQRVDPAVLIEDVVKLYEATMTEKKIVCRIQAPIAPLPEAWADPDKIRHVLSNLVSNAVKFTAEGGQIDVGSYPNKDYVCLFVQDNGIGIAKCDLGKIFDKFEQVRSARLCVKGPKGTGLGLSICRAIVELHGGVMAVESNPGKGSRFYFSLPVFATPPTGSRSQRVEGALL
jgi:signal transduction histidine kinase